jgi:type VI secretion system secreted protein Hcp
MKLRILFVSVAIAFAAVADVHGSFDTYIKTTNPTLDGEVSTPAAWVNAWGILSFSAGVSNPTSIDASGVHPSGHPNFQDLSVMKLLDKASVMSLQRLATGNHFDTVTLSCVNHATNALVFEIKLEQVYFSSISHSGSAGGDDRPTESVSFAYAKITWTYYPPTGSPITAFFDLRTQTGG